MIKKLLQKAGVKSQFVRKHARGPHTIRLCATILRNYKPGDKSFKYADCFSTRTFDVSGGGLCIAHPDRLLAGKYIMLNSRNNLKKVECMSCAMLGSVHDGFFTKGVVAKVMWATERQCGIKFVDISDVDRRKLDKLAKNSFA